MQFERLAATHIPEYLRNVPAMVAKFSSFEQLDVAEIGDGNLNYVYVVRNRLAPDESVVLKQAVPFMRLVGESWPLSRQRMHTEVQALRRFGELCPEHVPHVYHTSDEHSLVVMEHLAGYRVLRQEMIRGRVMPRLVDHLSTFLARTAFLTSDFHLGPDAKKAAAVDATNAELCKVTEDLVFTHPYEDHPGNLYSPALPRVEVARLQRSPLLRAAVAEMKYAFMTRTESFIHGDLHIGSVMVSDTETCVIDPEFAFYGPMAYDPAAILSNLFLAYFAQDFHQAARGDRPDHYRAWLLACARDLWIQFSDKFLGLWRAQDALRQDAFVGRGIDDGVGAEAFRQAFMKQLLANTLGFAAAEMMRRVLGLAKVPDITTIGDLELRAKVELKALRMAEKLAVERHSFASMEDVVELAKSVSPSSLQERQHERPSADYLVSPPSRAWRH